MLLDPSTAANLELLRNLRTGDPKSSLFGALNQCLTPAGTRYLRASLLQPCTDLVTICARLDCVSELLERPEVLQDVRKVLPAFAESDRVIRHFMQASSQTGCARAKVAISSVLRLKATLRAAPVLAAALTSNDEDPPRNELLERIVANLRTPELAEMEELIGAVIDDQACFSKKTSQRMLECLFAVRSKVCSFLDVQLATLEESYKDMEDLVAQYVEEFGLSELKLNYTDRRGYHLTLPASQREVVEANGFIRIASNAKKTVACST